MTLTITVAVNMASVWLVVLRRGSGGEEVEPDAEHPHVLGDGGAVLRRPDAALLSESRHPGVEPEQSDAEPGERGAGGAVRHESREQRGPDGDLGRGQGRAGSEERRVGKGCVSQCST